MSCSSALTQRQKLGNGALHRRPVTNSEALTPTHCSGLWNASNNSRSRAATTHHTSQLQQQHELSRAGTTAATSTTHSKAVAESTESSSCRN